MIIINIVTCLFTGILGGIIGGWAMTKIIDLFKGN